VYRQPEKYNHHIYGEHEAGGTDWLYITDVKFDELAMKKVRDEPYPDKVQGALSAPPFVMTLWPPLLMGLYAFSKRRSGNGHGDANGHGNESARSAAADTTQGPGEQR